MKLLNTVSSLHKLSSYSRCFYLTHINVMDFCHVSLHHEVTNPTFFILRDPALTHRLIPAHVTYCQTVDILFFCLDRFSYAEYDTERKFIEVPSAVNNEKENVHSKHN